MQEAEDSTRRLCALMEEVLRSNQDLASRFRGLEREGSIFAETSRDNISTTEPDRDSGVTSLVDTAQGPPKFTFDEDLHTSRPYRKAVNRPHSLFSVTSTALYTTALSVFSNLSLSQVSQISFYALPVYAADLSNSELYVFGDKLGVLLASEIAQPAQGSTSNSTPKPQARSRLLGRFARRRRQAPDPSPDPNIEAPTTFSHNVHISFNKETEEFEVGQQSLSGILRSVD